MHDADTPLSDQPLQTHANPPREPALPATIDLKPPAGPTPLWKRIMIDRNPLFLLSGVFMLIGCFLVSRHIHEHDPVEVGESAMLGLLITLLVVLNVYEFAVIGVGLALAKTRTLVRDARHLLGLALLLVVDAGFVYTETGIAEPMVGGLIAGLATGLACLKLWLILRVLGLVPTRRAVAVTTVSLGAMYALPIAVRLMADDGFLSQAGAMAVWSGVGLVAALHALPRRWARVARRGSREFRHLQRLVVAMVVGLPMISLVGHASAVLWVYQNTFEPAMLAPLLLGLSAVILRHPVRLGGARPASQAAALFVAAAVVAAMLPGEALVWASAQHTWVAASPLRAVLLVAPGLLAWAWCLGGRNPLGLIYVAMPWLAALLGHTPPGDAAAS